MGAICHRCLGLWPWMLMALIWFRHMTSNSNNKKVIITPAIYGASTLVGGATLMKLEHELGRQLISDSVSPLM